MRRITLLLLLIASVLLLISCGVETNMRDINTRYIGNYNGRYYFEQTIFNNNKNYISYLNEGKFINIEKINESYVIALIGNEILLTVNNENDIFSRTYKLLNLDTLEYKSIDISNWEELFNVSYIDNENIVFYSTTVNKPPIFLIYNMVEKKVIGDVSFDVKNYYLNVNTYFENQKLYVHFNYTTTNSNNYDYIYDVNSGIVTKVESVMSNQPTLRVEDKTLLFFMGNSQYETRGLWVNTGSVQEEYFTISDYGVLSRYNDHIVESRLYDNEVSILNNNFMVVKEYKVNYDCDPGWVISESELICIQRKTYGALINSQKEKIIIYNFISNKIVQQSKWFESGTQLFSIGEK